MKRDGQKVMGPGNVSDSYSSEKKNDVIIVAKDKTFDVSGPSSCIRLENVPLMRRRSLVPSRFSGVIKVHFSVKSPKPKTFKFIPPRARVFERDAGPDIVENVSKNHRFEIRVRRCRRSKPGFWPTRYPPRIILWPEKFPEYLFCINRWPRHTAWPGLRSVKKRKL